jgi:hypothetical protein
VEVTQPLKSGDKLPDHPSHTTSLKITKFGEVRDAENGQVLTGGLHGTTINSLATGNTSLSHLYRYAFRKIGQETIIFHTRKSVIIEVECEDA